MGFLWGATSTLSNDAANREIAVISIEKIIERMRTASQMEEIRAVIKGLKGFSRPYPLEVGSLAIRPLLSTIVGSIKVELMEQNMLREGRQPNVDPSSIHFEDAPIYPAIDDTETLLSIIQLLYYLCKPRDTPEFNSNVVPFAEIVMKEESEIHTLLHLLPLSTDLELRHQLLLFLELLLDYDAYRLTEILLSSPLAISNLVALLSELQDMVRDTTLMLLAKLTKGQHHELQKIIAFQNAFDRALDIIENEGGISGSKTVDDALILIGNLVARNPTNQRYFREIGGNQRLLVLFQLSLSGANWNNQEPHKNHQELPNDGHNGRIENGHLNSEAAGQLGTLLLGHVICRGLLTPLTTPSALLSQNALGIHAPLPFLTLLFDALQASVSLAWVSTLDRGTSTLGFNLRPLSYTQPEFVVGVLETIGHLVHKHTENQILFLSHTARGWRWDLHLALIATSPILSNTGSGWGTTELAIRDAAIFILTSLEDSLVETIVDRLDDDTIHHNATIINTQVNNKTFEASVSAAKGPSATRTPKTATSAHTPISIAIQLLTESEWEGSSLWPIHYASNILLAYLHHAQHNTELRQALLSSLYISPSIQIGAPHSHLTPSFSNGGIPQQRDDVNNGITSLVHFIMTKFLRPSHINLYVLKGDSVALYESRIERTTLVVCRSLFALLIHLATLYMEVFLEALTNGQNSTSTMSLHMLIEWISPAFDVTLLGGLAAFLFSQLVYSSALLDRLWDSNDQRNNGDPTKSDRHGGYRVLLELLHVRVGIDTVASRLALLQQHLFARFPNHPVTFPVLQQELGPISPTFLDASTVEIIRRSIEFLHASQQQTQVMQSSTSASLAHVQRSPHMRREDPLSTLPLHIQEVLSANERNTQALISTKEQLLVERDARIADQCATISEQRKLLEQATGKITDLSTQLSSLEESRLKVISKLEGQLETLSASYATLRHEHDQLLILLTDLTSPKAVGAMNETLLPSHCGGTFSVPSTSSSFETTRHLTVSKDVKSESSIHPSPPRIGALASVIPLLWKMMPTPIQNHLSLSQNQSDTSTGTEKTVVGDNPMSPSVSVNNTSQFHALVEMSASISPPIDGSMEHSQQLASSFVPQSDNAGDAQSLFLNSSDNTYESTTNYGMPITTTSLPTEYPVEDYTKQPYLSDVHSYGILTSNMRQTSALPPREPMLAALPTLAPMPPNFPTYRQQPDFNATPPGTIHPYYLNMGNRSVSFQDSLGFVPQPELDY